MSTAAKIDQPTALPSAVWSDWSCLVRLIVSDRQVIDAASADLRRLMGRVERAASRFRADSELCWANANAGRPVPVSRTLVNLVQIAIEQGSRSNGLVDPTLGRDLIRVGYDRDISLVENSSVEIGSPDSCRRSWRDIALDHAAGLLTVPGGSALDLGASAKAHTADWAAADLNTRYGCDVLVEIGGDLAVAGSRRWQVNVAEKVDHPGQQVTVKRGGLATSTTTIRRWRRGSAAANHIIDPRSRRCAEGRWRTVTVAADTATFANTCSTGAIVLGEDATAWLQRQGVSARLVDQDGAVVTVGDWPTVEGI
jgi:thiamine biosynthesis lipoprotein